MTVKNYYIKQKLISIRDKFTIKDDKENDCFYGKSKLIAATKTIDLFDNNDQLLYKIKKKIFSFLPKFYVYEKDTKTVAAFAAAKFTFFRPKYKVTINDEEYSVSGNMFAWDFLISRGNITVATISKKIFAIRDHYTVSILEGENEPLLLAIVLILDFAYHSRNKRRSGFSVGSGNRF